MPGLGRSFEMRRMEALSNTIFGVAMTLLAYQAPKQQFATTNPQWPEIWHVYGAHLMTLLLSFIVAGMFWQSHQRRLAYAPEAGRSEVFVNLLFLLSIILLPVTTGLYGNYVEARDVTALYGFNLVLIAIFNTLLWVFAVWPRGDWYLIAAPVFSLAIFVVALTAVLIEPSLTRFILPTAFIAPLVASYFENKRRRPPPK